MKHVDIIVTRHPALVDLLRAEGFTCGRVAAHVSADDVRGRSVAGVLPLHLAAEADCVYTVDLDIPPDRRGVELGLEELRRYYRGIRQYFVFDGQTIPAGDLDAPRTAKLAEIARAGE